MTGDDDTDPSEFSGLPQGVEPDGSITSEPPEFEDAPRNALTPMGQVDAMGALARGLGPRRVKFMLGAVALLVLAVAFVNTVG